MPSRKPNGFIAKICGSLSSKWFLLGVVILFVLQALWIAFSFRYPMLYDESFHFGVIKIFGQQFSPLITNQPPAHDFYGNLANGDASLYHYMMSFPYRLISTIADSVAVQVVFLRTLNVLMAAVGLVLFARLFRKIGIKQAYINVSLLVFVLLPIVPFVAAMINYDNLLFPLTAAYLLLCLRLIQNPKVLWYEYANLIAVGCFTSLVKNTFLPVFAASVIYLAIIIIRRHGKKFLFLLLVSLKKAKRPWLAAVAVALVIIIGLFSTLYIQNLLRYGTPKPDCVRTLSRERCLANGIARRNLQHHANRDQRPLTEFSDFTQSWLEGMRATTLLTGTNTDTGVTWRAQGLPVMHNLVFFLPFLGIGVLLYAWRSLRKNVGWHFLLTMVVVSFTSVYVYNTQIYYDLHAAFAVQARYLLNLLPVLLVMIVVACNYTLRRPWLKLACLVVVLLLFTQGGGVVNHILQSQDDWYWQNEKVIQANHMAKKILAPLVQEE